MPLCEVLGRKSGRYSRSGSDCEVQTRKLFRRYTRNAMRPGSPAALLASTRSGAKGALYMYINVADDFGLSVSVPKMKLMVTGREVIADDRAPILEGDDQIESVTQFPYLGSVIVPSGRMLPDIDQRIAKHEEPSEYYASQCLAAETIEWRQSARCTRHVSPLSCCMGLSAGHLSGKI